MAPTPVKVDTTMASSGQPLDMQQATQTRLKGLFEKRMNIPSRAIRHEKTSVLLLSWDPGYDDLKVKEEVGALGDIFARVYGFKVYDKQIREAGATGEKKPRHQVNAHLSNFVLDEDSERGLLIIYYAGHGYAGPDSGDMNLVGRLAPPGSQEAKYAEDKQLKRNSIVWSQVEPAISNTDADVLLIFDCCNAGRLCRTTRALPRNFFEFLGACSQNETTRGPGEQSFTSAMIWALQQLAKKEEAFSTFELWQRIMKHEHFPDEQTPVLADRRDGEHIVISRKGLQSAARKAPSKLERHQELLQREYIDLRFHFEHNVEPDHVEETADALKHLMDTNKISCHRVTFHGKYSIVEHAVGRFLTLRNAARTRKNTLSTASPSDRPVQFLETPSASPEMTKLMPQIPRLPYTPAPSDRPSRASSVQLCDERTYLVARRTESRRRYVDDGSIQFHLHAIWTRILARLSGAFEWLAERLSPGPRGGSDDIESQTGLAIPNIRYEQGLTTPKVAAQPQADRPSRVG